METALTEIVTTDKLAISLCPIHEVVTLAEGERATTRFGGVPFCD